MLKSILETILASFKLISRILLIATSVTKAVFVKLEIVDQHVARWSGMVNLEVRVEESVGEMERMPAPKEASVVKILGGLAPGMTWEPKRTAVPGGLDRVSFVESLGDMPPIFEAQESLAIVSPPSTAKTLRNPVLLAIGFPFTVVKSRLWSSEKNVCETVFVGPTGGSLCPIPNGRSASMGPIPVRASKFAQDIPDLEPVVPTHTSEFFTDAATVLGNVPGKAAGRPTRCSFRGSEGEIASIDTVFDPAFTANMCWPAIVRAD